jgi:Alpha/beta hydrolase domain
MAEFSGPVTAGRVIEPVSVVQPDLAASGYLEEEFFASGTARSYARPDQAAESGQTDQRAVQSGAAAPFLTRVVVRRPADPGRFSGTLLVEWLNVSSGFEADPDWLFLHEEILRAGHAYAAVSAQALGITGGTSRVGFPGQFPGLRASDPARYGTLAHPGDQYSFDIFDQIGQALRTENGPTGALGALAPSSILAIGESQSAFYLTTYIKAVHGPAPVFDGFFVHSRGAGAASLDGSGLGDPGSVTAGVRISTDVTVPVLVFETEGDVVRPLSYWLARQPDSDRLRSWEVAGTAHADAYLIGSAAAMLGCDWRVNEGPQRFVAQAALHALNQWVSEGTPPPRAPVIELARQDPAVIARDAAGIAIGGVRTPAVDVPAYTLSGAGPPGSGALGWLVGSNPPLDGAVLLRLYGGKAGYLDAYARAADEAISQGFLLAVHRADLLAAAEAVVFPR